MKNSAKTETAPAKAERSTAAAAPNRPARSTTTTSPNLPRDTALASTRGANPWWMALFLLAYAAMMGFVIFS